MEEKKKEKGFKAKDFYRICLALAIFLLLLIASTGSTFLGAFLTYILAYVFGYFYPFVIAILMLFSLKLLFGKKFFSFKNYKGVYLGILLVFFSSLCFASYNLIVKDPSFNFSKLSFTYNDLMLSFARRPYSIDSFDSLSSLGGGYIGAFAVALFGSIWHQIGDAILFSFLMLLGIFLIVYRPLILGIKKLKNVKDKKKNYSSEYQKEEEKTSDDLIDDYSSWDNESISDEDDGEIAKLADEESTLLKTSSYPVIEDKNDSRETPYYENNSSKNDDKESELFEKQEEKEDEYTDNKIDDNEYTEDNSSSVDFRLKESESSLKEDIIEKQENREDYFFSGKSEFDEMDAFFDDEDEKQNQKIKSDNLQEKIDAESEKFYQNSLKKNNTYVMPITEKEAVEELNREKEKSYVSEDNSFYGKENLSSSQVKNSTYPFKETQEENISPSSFESFSPEQENTPSKNNSSFADDSCRSEKKDENMFVDSFNPLEEQAKRASKVQATNTITVNMKDDSEKESDDDLLSDVEKEALICEEYFKKKREQEEKIKKEKQQQKQRELDEVMQFVSPVQRVYNYPLPSDDLLEDLDDSDKIEINRQAAEEKGRIINSVFQDFNIQARIQSSTIGSSVTRLNVSLDKGVRSDKLKSITSEIQRALKGDKSVRIETVVEGQDMPGIEIGNAKPMGVSFKEVFTTIEQNTKDPLLIPIGKDISGNIITYPLNKMPHLLIAGATGSGKSVMVHSIIMTLLMRNYPSRLKMMFIDPKKVEFARYEMEPHLFCPVISDAKEAVTALIKLCDEMERRYLILKKYSVVNMDDYREIKKNNRDFDMPDIPDIVVVIDEFADLMQTSDNEVADYVQRLTQKARAAGIYLIIATQRPEKSVIPMVIKGNITCRLCLSCSTQVDSRVILDEPGAETLIGRGDLLFKSTTNRNLIRAQSPFISNSDMIKVLSYLKRNAGTPNYSPDFLDLKDDIQEDELSSYSNPSEHAYESVKDFVQTTGITSKSTIMKNFSLSYSKADQILVRLKQEGIVEIAQGNRLKVVRRKDFS